MTWLRDLYLTARRIVFVALVGAIVGGYGVHRLESQPLAELVARGYCGQRDPAQTLFFYPCRDAYFAAQLERDAAARDDEVTQILSDMAKTQPVRKVKQ